MHPINIILLAACIYVPILTLLFLAEIWTVLKPGSPFKSSFYILFVVGAVVDLFTVCADMYELRLIFFPLVNGLFENYDCYACASARLAFSYICHSTQDLLSMLIALNRYTSIRQPLEHTTIWKKLLPLAVPGSIILSVVLYAIAFFRKVSYLKGNLGDWVVYFLLEDPNPLPWYKTHQIMSIEIIITNIATIVMYAIAGRSLGKMTSETARKAQERKLLIFGIVNFAIQIPGLFIQIMFGFNFFPIEWNSIVAFQLTWMIDLKCFSAAVTMIVINTTFRKHMLLSFGFRKRKRSISIKPFSNS